MEKGIEYLVSCYLTEKEVSSLLRKNRYKVEWSDPMEEINEGYRTFRTDRELSSGIIAKMRRRKIALYKRLC